MFYHATGTEAYGFRSSVFVKGGIGVLSEALAAAARGHGAEVATRAAVERILVQDGVATGVLLADGEEIRARCVVSGGRSPPHLLRAGGSAPSGSRVQPQGDQHPAPGDHRDPSPAARRAPAIAGRRRTPVRSHPGGSGPGLPGASRATARKYGRCSARPHLDMVVPTLHNPALAPAGRHLASIQIRYAPWRLRSGSWQDDATRDALRASVLDVLDDFLPGLRDRIVDHRLLTPLDLETELGLTGGDEYHGQMGLDQLLFMRPVPGWGRYRTPVEHLFLCGSGTHPGGGVTGRPGSARGPRDLARCEIGRTIGRAAMSAVRAAGGTRSPLPPGYRTSVRVSDPRPAGRPESHPSDPSPPEE